MPDYTRTRLKTEDTLQRAIETIEAATIQIALVMDEEGRLLGTVTDGDIRRGLLSGVTLGGTVDQVMNTHAVTALAGTPRGELLALLTSRKLKQVPLLDDQGRVVGLELLDDLIESPTLKDNSAIILAGGQGTRLRPLTDSTPKPLLRVGGKPVLELIIQQLRTYGFQKLFISVNYKGSQIEEYFGDGTHQDVAIEYLREPEPLGTAGPLALLPAQDKPCLIINGDLLTSVRLDRMLDFHQEGGFSFTIGVKEYPYQIPFGVIETIGDRVVSFREKPTEAHLINAGVYILEPAVLAMVPSGGYYDMNSLITDMLDKPECPVGAFVIHEYWTDIGNATDYLRAQNDYPAHFLKETGSGGNAQGNQA